MPQLTVNGIRIDDTFAEAFGMRATALVITAPTAAWARQAAVTMTGYGTSVIGCGAEAGIDRDAPAAETPDGRPGVRVLLFSTSTAELQKQLQNRVGQCVLTSPGSACYAGLEGEDTLKLGNALRFFGDGLQVAKRLGDKRYWRIPVMDGEFVCEATTGLTRIRGRRRQPHRHGCTSARRRSLRPKPRSRPSHAVPDVIMPFPGGIARSGSKVGSKYKGAIASTNDAYCPTLKGSRPQRTRRRHRLGAGDRYRRPHLRCCRRRHARRPCRHRRSSGRSAARCASAPAITAASSGRITTI